MRKIDIEDNDNIEYDDMNNFDILMNNIPDDELNDLQMLN
jgi:hypothetical protein